MGLSGVQIVCLVVIVLAVGWLIVLDRPRSRAWATRRVTSKLPFDLTLDAAERLRRRVMRDQRAAPIVIGAAAGTLFVAATLDAEAAAAPVFVSVMALVMVAHLVAPFHHSAELLLQPVPGVPEGPRVARPRVLQVSDYVRRFDLAAVRATTAATVLLMATTVVGCLRAGVELSVLPYAAVGVVVVLAAVCVELGAAHTVRRVRPAGTARALMSEDALTSSALRTAYYALGSIAWFGVFVVPLASGTVDVDALPWPEVRGACFVATVLGWVVCSTTLELDSSVRYFLVRLWGLPRRLPTPVLAPHRPGDPYRGGPS